MEGSLPEQTACGCLRPDVDVEKARSMSVSHQLTNEENLVHACLLVSHWLWDRWIIIKEICFTPATSCPFPVLISVVPKVGDDSFPAWLLKVFSSSPELFFVSSTNSYINHLPISALGCAFALMATEFSYSVQRKYSVNRNSDSDSADVQSESDRSASQSTTDE